MIQACDLPDFPAPRLTAFSFGGGVQSTAILALLKHQPSIFTDAGLTLPTLALFADTGAEKPSVLAHLERLQAWGIPLELRTVQNHRHGGHVEQMGRPPWFVLSKEGTNGQIIRSCTDKWKIRPLERAYKQAAGFAKGARIPPGSIHLWLGISTDEASRAGMSRKAHTLNLYPLLEIGWSRVRCLEYLAEVLPWPVPKSACTFCPYTNPREWERVEREDPEHWDQAVEVDSRLRSENRPRDLYIDGDAFVHPARLPLPEAVRRWRLAHLPAARGEQALFDFDAMEQECSGLCGV